MTITYYKRNLENIDKLADHTKIVALKWHDYLVKNDINILIYETIRTVETQRENVRKGASKTMKSYHLVGQALDFVPVNSKGQSDWKGYDNPKIKQAIAEAKRLGFEWGGDWKSFIDKPHLQFNHKGYGTDTFGKYTELKKMEVVEKMSKYFKDVPQSHWALNEIDALKEKGVLAGKTDGTFGIGETVKREEVAVLINRAIDYVIKNKD